MAVGLKPLPELLPVRGVRVASVAAGIRYKDRPDVTLFEFAPGTRCAGVFTRNAFCAAPVQVARAHLAAGAVRYWLVNSGNANAGTGEPGMAAARESCVALARLAGCAPEGVLPFSTGVIGEPLPVERLCAALPQALSSLSPDSWAGAARGIMTTDTLPKGASRAIKLPDGEVVVTGIAKGAGMIHPDMATMLAYIATDAAVEADDLQRLLVEVADESFNSVTVDGDTSTNDACVLAATGASGVRLTPGAAGWDAFAEAVAAVARELAQAIVRDGEGAGKFITIQVEGGRDREECRRVAFTIAHSPLVKTAFFASDPNWGRILAAAGRAGIDGFDVSRVGLFLDDVCIARDGGRAAEYREEDGKRVMARAEITVRLVLGRGDALARVWTCDLSHEYVRINADYRS